MDRRNTPLYRTTEFACKYQNWDGCRQCTRESLSTTPYLSMSEEFRFRILDNGSDVARTLYARHTRESQVLFDLVALAVVPPKQRSAS